jgi:hypothetical protein
MAGAGKDLPRPLYRYALLLLATVSRGRERRVSRLYPSLEFPVPEDWRRIRDASERLRETYNYHRATEPMMTRVLAEARDLPIVEPYPSPAQQIAHPI